MGDILVEARGHIRIVTIQNESKRNAVNRAMEQALLDALLGADIRPRCASGCDHRRWKCRLLQRT